jgi:ABC-type nickel/cobalt efflux system permease component RcnA
LLGTHRHRVDWESIDLDRPLGWRALVTLGLSGGMVPSASAVIVLLGAVQVGKVPFGAALILAFGVGLSAALVGVGLGVVAVTRRTHRYLDTHALAERFSRLLTPLAAVALLLVGAWLAYRALGRI